MQEILYNFILSNYLVVLALAALLFLTIYDRHVSPTDRRRLYLFIFIAFILLIAVSGESYINTTFRREIDLKTYYTVEDPYPYYYIRDYAMQLGYILKPFMLFLSICVLFPISKESMCNLFIPAILNALLSFTSHWTHWVYFVDYSNHWHQGPLAFFYFLCFLFYCVVFLVEFAIEYRSLSGGERAAIIITFIALGCSLLYDKYLATMSSNAFISSSTYAMVVYFMCLNITRSNSIIDFQNERMTMQRNAILNSQIQPHFVYNTLSVIRTLCGENPDMAAKCIDDFSRYLRNSTNFGSEEGTIPVERELENCKLFSGLEQIRFENLQVKYIIHDGGYDIPFLTIQPMVENAIRHGVRNTEGGLVRVSLSTDLNEDFEPMHKIEIRDNGTGRSLVSGNPGDHRGIGISNTKARIYSLCGGTLDVEFMPTGTVVTILIPAKEKDTIG